jgi:hypothetical protein
MLDVFKRGARPREILDLTAPAGADDGIVDRWLRETTARADSDSDSPMLEAPAPEEGQTPSV